MYTTKPWKELLNIISGKNQKEVINESGQYPIYGSGGIIGRSDRFLCPANSVIIGRKGTIDRPLYVEEPFWNIDTAFGLVPRETLMPKFLYYFCSIYNFKSLDKSTGRPSVSKTDLLKIEMPVPPILEQEKIVSRIEELFSELDKGVETLQIIKQQLVVYRQAVLKGAFDSANANDNSQTAMLSIENILSKNKRSMTTGPFGTMLKKSEHKTYGIPVLGIENIGKGKFKDGNRIFVTEEKAKELNSFILHKGDIIISRSGTVGEICEVPEHIDGALLSTNLMKVSLNQDIIIPDYFIYLFQSKGVVLDQVKELCKGSTRLFLNQTILKRIIFPIPNLNKQREIIAKIESRLSVCDSIEQTVDTALSQTEAVRQSILKKAFEGRLSQ